MTAAMPSQQSRAVCLPVRMSVVCFAHCIYPRLLLFSDARAGCLVVYRFQRKITHTLISDICPTTLRSACACRSGVLIGRMTFGGVLRVGLMVTICDPCERSASEPAFTHALAWTMADNEYDACRGWNTIHSSGAHASDVVLLTTLDNITVTTNEKGERQPAPGVLARVEQQLLRRFEEADYTCVMHVAPDRVIVREVCVTSRDASIGGHLLNQMRDMGRPRVKLVRNAILTVFAIAALSCCALIRISSTTC